MMRKLRGVDAGGMRHTSMPRIKVNGGLSNLIWLDIKVTVKLKVVNEI
jgi:hypothetical protein